MSQRIPLHTVLPSLVDPMLASVRSSPMRRVAGVLALLAVTLVFPAARASTPFEAGNNAAILPALDAGGWVRREGGTLTADDRARLGTMGLGKMHSAVVALHKIPKRDAGRQMARLDGLVHAVGGFAPSEACDALVTQGDHVGLCTGTVDGPLGKVPVRMPVNAKLTREPSGVVRLAITNHAPMEARPLVGWSEVVAPGHLKVIYEMFPTDDGWLVYTRIGVEMSAHEKSAKTITDAMVKLDVWLTRELAKG